MTLIRSFFFLVFWVSWLTPSEAQVSKRVVFLESTQPQYALVNQLFYQALDEHLPASLTLERQLVSKALLASPGFVRGLGQADYLIGPFDSDLADLSPYLSEHAFQLALLFPRNDLASSRQWIFSLSPEAWIKGALRETMMGRNQLLVIKEKSPEQDQRFEQMLDWSGAFGLADVQLAEFSGWSQLQKALEQTLQLDLAKSRCDALKTRLHLGVLECEMAPRQDLDGLVYFGESRGLPLLLDLLKLHQIYWPVDWWVTDQQAFDLVLPSDAPRVVSHLLSSNQQLDVKKGRIGMRLSEAPISHWAASVLRLIVAREVGAVEIGGEFDLPAGRFVLEQGVFYPVSTPSKP